MGNIKSLLVEFIMAFFLGIAGWIAIFYIIAYGTGGAGTDVIVFAIFTGLPLGSSLGIFITKKCIFRSGFRSGTFNVLCLYTSLLFGFLAARFLWQAIPDYICDLMGPRGTDRIVFPLVPLFALIGYNAMEMLLRRRKESPK